MGHWEGWSTERSVVKVKLSDLISKTRQSREICMTFFSTGRSPGYRCNANTLVYESSKCSFLIYFSCLIRLTYQVPQMLSPWDHVGSLLPILASAPSGT